MRVAGVRLADGRTVWVEVGDTDLAAGDTALVQLSSSAGPGRRVSQDPQWAPRLVSGFPEPPSSVGPRPSGPTHSDPRKPTTHGGELTGFVFVSPDQLVRPPDQVDGTLTEVRQPAASDVDCADLPGADMPPLGSTVDSSQGVGMVTAIDAVARSLTLTRADGTQVQLSTSEIQEPET